MYASSSLIQPVDCQIKITVDLDTVSKFKGTRFDPFVQMSATIGSPKVHHPSRFREALVDKAKTETEKWATESLRQKDRTK